MEFLQNFPKKEGVFILDQPTKFEGLYIGLREKEGRVISDEELARLPFPLLKNKHYREWELRVETLNRFILHLKKKSPNSVLDIGCGNGWFSSKLANYCKVLATDINLNELQQARRVFIASNLEFAYVAELKKIIEVAKFDLITFNASAHYFDKLPQLIQDLKKGLNPSGEIHILDTSVYASKEEASAARLRSQDYYSSQGFPELSKYYFHYTYDDLGEAEILFKPKGKWGRRLVSNQRSPFPWLCFTKD